MRLSRLSSLDHVVDTRTQCKDGDLEVLEIRFELYRGSTSEEQSAEPCCRSPFENISSISNKTLVGFHLLVEEAF